jgi:hypothetical protein
MGLPEDFAESFGFFEIAVARSRHWLSALGLRDLCSSEFLPGGLLSGWPPSSWLLSSWLSSGWPLSSAANAPTDENIDIATNSVIPLNTLNKSRRQK